MQKVIDSHATTSSILVSYGFVIERSIVIPLLILLHAYPSVLTPDILLFQDFAQGGGAMLSTKIKGGSGQVQTT